MVNDSSDDLLDLIRQKCAEGIKEKRVAIHIEEDSNPRGDIYKVYVLVDGHDLWMIGLNKDHSREDCEKCAPPSL